MRRSHPSTAKTSSGRRQVLFASTMLAGMLSLACATGAQALPAGGQVAAGGATIAQEAGGMTVSQSTQNAAINWQSFSIAAGEAVSFVQPNSQSIALNRVLGADPSSILGSLSANGKVFLVNPNGVLFGRGAQVNVAGLTASTLNITDTDFMAGHYSFAGTSGAAVLNQGSITADGGYVALLGAKVSNEGVIIARMGTVVLAAGEGVTLDVAGDGLLKVAVDKGAVDALVANGGLIRADGGQVMLTARAAGQLLRTVVNNTGIIEARTLQSHDGSISLMGDAESGVVNVAGTLDASAPNGGDGGFVETSAATVNVSDAAVITTLAPAGVTGTWLIDPEDFFIGPRNDGTAGNISGSNLGARLITTSVTISTTGPTVVVTPSSLPTTAGTAGTGKITVNDAVSWTATPNPTTLTLNAAGDVIINNAISPTNGNFVVCCGADVHVNGVGQGKTGAITIIGGSVLLSAGQDLFLDGPITTVGGNIALCAGRNLSVSASMTLTGGSIDPLLNLALMPGLTLIAGYAGSGVGLLTLPSVPATQTVTGPNASVLIAYVPPSYAAPIDFSTKLTRVSPVSVPLVQKMLVFPTVTKTADGLTTATLTSLLGAPANVALSGAGTAVFDSAGVGNNIGITYTGYSLTGINAAAFSFGQACCTTTFRSSGNIVAPVAPPPAPTPTPTPTPVVIAPVVVVPVVLPIPTPPAVVAPIPTPLVVATPAVTPVVVLLEAAPVVAPVATPQAFLYPALAVGAPAGLRLAVLEGGVRMPAPIFIAAAPQPSAPQSSPPQRYTAPAAAEQAPASAPAPARPARPRKQDRH